MSKKPVDDLSYYTVEELIHYLDVSCMLFHIKPVDVHKYLLSCRAGFHTSKTAIDTILQR